MTEFLNRPLQVVSRLYQFLNADVPRSDFDLTTRIQPVHDYSREAELGGRGIDLQGYLELGQTLANATAGATVIHITTDVYAAFDSITQFSDFRSVKDRLWLIAVFGSVDAALAGNWTSATTGINMQSVSPSRIRGLAHWNVDIDPLVAVSGRPMVLDETQPFPLITEPIYLPLGTIWATAAASTDDCTARVHAIFWAGRIGTTPPGMR